MGTDLRAPDQPVKPGSPRPLTIIDWTGRYLEDYACRPRHLVNCIDLKKELPAFNGDRRIRSVTMTVSTMKKEMRAIQSDFVVGLNALLTDPFTNSE